MIYAEFLRNRKPSHRLSSQWGRRSAYYPEALRIIREAKGDVLTESEGKRLLALYEITREALASRAADAAQIAQDLTFPVAMRIESAEILHKTDVGGVVLNISSPDKASAAFEQIMASVRSHRPEAKIRSRRARNGQIRARNGAWCDFRSAITSIRQSRLG
ncbi:acetate--CoA ligase family protein [Bradyrhizobium sp. 142]|uniref:acetate--CoA ligase family protein n=1 Tax=Bradyrhizobium sp. 142 TaxID=2782618 RepID=UPI001FF98646|nr:acetate--CoA ligase family protein [Bradyrhizobium sp. 142]MCK1730525.1 acetate--CoA ligase family protein [Bradyrhizobium sp. 142]